VDRGVTELASRPEAWLAVGFLAGGVAGAAGGCVITQHVMQGPRGSNALWSFIFELAGVLWTLLWAGGIMLGLLWIGSRLGWQNDARRTETTRPATITPRLEVGASPESFGSIIDPGRPR